MEIQVYKTQGIIIKTAELSGTDRLLTVYTKERGKILVRAKGVGKKESKLKSLLEPFNFCEFMLARSRTIDVLAGVYPIKEFNYLHNNLESLAYAFYFAELTDKIVTEPENDVNLWRLILRAFEVLNEKRNDLSKIKEAFENKLLEFLGHPSPAERGKINAAQRLNYFESLADEEIKSVSFLRSVSLMS